MTEETEKEILDARAAFRLPSAVLQEWKQKANENGYRNLSDFLRAAVDGKLVTHIATPDLRKRKQKLDDANKCDPRLIAQLAQIGNNMNQIAKALNQCKLNGSTVELIEVLAVLYSIEEKASALFPKLPSSPSDTRTEETVQRMRERAEKARKAKAEKENAY